MEVVMNDPRTQVFVFMFIMCLLGLCLGWLLWGWGRAKKVKLLTAEVDFWKSNLEQSRAERQADINRIEALSNERDVFRRQVAASRN